MILVALGCFVTDGTKMPLETFGAIIAVGLLAIVLDAVPAHPGPLISEGAPT